MNNRPLVVHSDRMVYLLEKLDSDYNVEDQLNVYATLIQTPNNVHTYCIDEYSLWSASLLDYSQEDIIDFLKKNSKNILHQDTVEYIKKTLKEFWEMDLTIENKVFILTGNTIAIDKILKNNIIKSKVIKRKNNSLIFKIKDLYEIRKILLCYNIFLRENFDSYKKCNLKLNQDVVLYRHQLEAVNKFIKFQKEHLKGRGVIVMPPGSGKTITALKIIEILKVNTLILVNSEGNYNTWVEEIKQKTNFNDGDIGYNDLNIDKPINICTYSHLSKVLNNTEFNSEWGFIIYDNANCLPAAGYSKTAYITSKYKLAMDSILWRSDNREYIIFKAIGPKVFNLTLKKLEEEKYQIKVKCYEVKVPFIPWDVNEEKNENHTYSKNLNKIEAYKNILKLHKSEQKILVSHYIKVGEKHSKVLKIPCFDGKSNYELLVNAVKSFNNKEINSMILIDIFENQFLKDIDVLVSLSYNGKSVREEYKRIGKLKGSNNDNVNKTGYYYALVSQDSIEEEKYSVRRNDMLKYGYNFKIITMDELWES